MPAPAQSRTKEEVRAEIDRLDRELVRLLGERFAYVRRMAELKQDPTDADDPARVEAVLAKVAAEAKAAGVDPELVRSLWQRLIDWNIDWERKAIEAGPSGQTMSAEEFLATLDQAEPPAGLSVALRGLWWSAKGDWDKAHVTVQDDPSREAAWVHAHLHRIEGDLDNAGYWYERANRNPSGDKIEDEREEIARMLLRGGAK